MAKRVPNQTLAQQLAAAEQKAAKLRHQISERRRAAEARRKIVIGGTIELAMQDDPALRAQVIDLLRQHVTRPLDMEVVAHLLNDGKPIDQQAPADPPASARDAAMAAIPEAVPA